MNNENPNTNSAVIPEIGEEPKVETPALQVIDPTASFQTVDPTATEELTPVEAAPEAAPEAASDAPLTPEVSTTVETLTPQEEAPTSPAVKPMTSAVPKVNPVHMESATASATRYNPVTGEEMSMNQLLNKPETAPEVDAINNDEKLKKVEIDPKQNSKANSIMLIIFFIALILFVVFLPDIQTLIALRKAGPQKTEEITTGKLVCTLESNTVNLDRSITRVFDYTDKKLQSAKFTTVVRGSSTVDAEALDEIDNQCKQIRENVDGMNGITVSCNYEEGKVTEKETFDYSVYSLDEVSAAYTEAGGSVLEFEQDEDIDQVMTLMRQGGFTCNKEK